jgi:hypothetical protein
MAVTVDELRADCEARIDVYRSEVVRLRKQLTDQAQRWASWKRRATAIAHRMGDRHGWCPEYDDILSAIGLTRRGDAYTVVVTPNFGELALSVQARSPSEARDNVDADMVEEAVESRLADLWYTDWRVRRVERRDPNRRYA